MQPLDSLSRLKNFRFKLNRESRVRLSASSARAAAGILVSSFPHHVPALVASRGYSLRCCRRHGLPGCAVRATAMAPCVPSGCRSGILFSSGCGRRADGSGASPGPAGMGGGAGYAGTPNRGRLLAGIRCVSRGGLRHHRASAGTGRDACSGNGREQRAAS